MVRLLGSIILARKKLEIGMKTKSWRILARGCVAKTHRKAERYVIASSTHPTGCSALACPDRSTGSWHQTSEMIQEDMKIMEPQRTQRSLRKKHGETGCCTFPENPWVNRRPLTKSRHLTCLAGIYLSPGPSGRRHGITLPNSQGNQSFRSVAGKRSNVRAVYLGDPRLALLGSSPVGVEKSAAQSPQVRVFWECSPWSPDQFQAGS